jgi:hypothetical protein
MGSAVCAAASPQVANKAVMESKQRFPVALSLTRRENFFTPDPYFVN